jgi:chromatin remodeling complex protein RSC6
MAKKKRKTAKRKTGRKSGLTTMTYSTTSELQAVIGGGKMTRPQIVKKLWVYIKKHGLQNKVKRRMIEPDAKLGKVIGSRPIDMLKLATHLNKHIKK